jgi:hypothetical protein
MQKTCKKCGNVFKVKPSKADKTNFCNKICASRKLKIPCKECSLLVERVPSQILKDVYCGKECAKIGKSKKFTAMNIKLNPTRMTVKTRTKIRNAHLGKGECKGYEKTFGVHTHRIVAAEKLGRPLKKGEIVHHIDEVKRNNSPENLEVFASQAEHAKLHFLKNNPNAKKR